MSEDFFIQIKNLTAPRIDLLETSKLVLESMRVYEKIFESRAKKIKATKELKEQIKELLFLHTRLLEKLPHQNLVSEPIKKESKSTKGRKKSTTKKQVKKAEVPVIDDQNVDKIGQALSEIESKLKQLN